MARSTPASREEPPKKGDDRKPKLVASNKVIEFCRRTGQDVNKYLLRLEDSGMTQVEIDSAGQLGRRAPEEGRVHAWDRKRAASR